MEISRSQGADKALESTLNIVRETLTDLINGKLSAPIYHLASFEPGSGKTGTLCSFLQAWKSSAFLPSAGALIVLSTHKEIMDCVYRARLSRDDFAIMVQKDHCLNDLGNPDLQAAPVLFTTQEKLRRICSGQPSFAAIRNLHFLGQPRRLRVWDEAFLPAPPASLRRDTLLAPLEELRPVSPFAAASLEALAASLDADMAGEVVEVPADIRNACMTVLGRSGEGRSDRWRSLLGLAGKQALLVPDGGNGLCLAGSGQSLPDDFAPALILDASGRVRETYKTMEAAGRLKRLDVTAMAYSRLRIHHWNRAASRSTLKDNKARAEVLQAAAQVINDSGEGERWLVIHPMAREADGYDALKELRGLVQNPDRLTSLHWGNHHGTNEYREIRKVLVLGLWHFRRPVYASLHIAAGGSPEGGADPVVLKALEDGEHCHNLLQAVCRASVREWTDGVCGACEVFLVGRLGPDGGQLLEETFPGTELAAWEPTVSEPTGAAHRLIQELERAFSVPGVRTVRKDAVRAALGLGSTQALAKAIRKGDFKVWAADRGLEVTTRAFELVS